MKRSRKLTLFTLIVLFVVTCVMGLVACGGKGAKEAIKMYILPQAETLVSEDFTLPKKIGKDGAVEVKWTSSNEDAIKVEDNGGEEYNAKVTLQSEVTDVTLTIKAGSHKKNFTVRVDALTVSTFIEHYEFPYLNRALKANEYDLATSVEVQGKTATIAWTVPENSKAYISLNADGSKLTVGSVDEQTPVSLQAKFTYGEQTANRTYAFYAAPNTTHLQDVNNRFSKAGSPVEISGYIVYINEVSASHGNATFYMVDDDFCSGYYMYRVKIDTEKIDKYVLGAYVNVSGATAKDFSGIWENNSDGTATVDESKAKIDPSEHIYDFDTDVLSGAASALWHEGMLVRLSGWKCTSKASSKPDGTKTATLFTLTRDSVNVTVAFSKYDTYADKEAILDLADTVEVNSCYDVVGILSKYEKDFQILPHAASDVKEVEEEGTNEVAAKIEKAIDKVEEGITTNFKSEAGTAKLFVNNSTVTMPVGNITEAEGVTVSYEVAGVANPTVEIDNTTGSFTITPIETNKTYEIMVTYTLGEYKAYSFFTLRNWRATDQQIVDLAAKNVRESTMTPVGSLGEHDFPTVDLLNCSITWALKDNTLTWVEVSGNKLVLKNYPEVRTHVVLVATVTKGEASATAEISVRIDPNPFTALTEPQEGTFKLMMYQGNKGAYYWGNGKMDGYYFGATTDVSEAADYTITKVGDNQYTITVGGKYVEVVPRIDSQKGVNVLLNDERTAGKYWQWNSDIQNFVCSSTKNTSDPAVLYYLGTFSSNETFSANAITYIANQNDDGSYTLNGKEGVSQWVGHFGTVKS